MMTTIAVVRKGGFAAIAADTLTKWGSLCEWTDYIVNAEKIIKLQESYIAIAGPTAAKQVLTHYLATPKLTLRLENVEQIFASWHQLHAALKEHYYLQPHEDQDDCYESSRMDVLIANPAGIFGVSAHRAVQEFSRFYAYGAGREFALGAMYALYDQEALSAEEIARQGIAAAAAFDDGTGLPIHSYQLALRG